MPPVRPGEQRAEGPEEVILRLANEDDRFRQAILDFYEADPRYNEARGRRDD